MRNPDTNTHKGFSPTPSVALYRSIAASCLAGVSAPMGNVRFRNVESLLRSSTGEVQSVMTHGKTGYCVTSARQFASGETICSGWTHRLEYDSRADLAAAGMQTGISWTRFANTAVADLHC